MNQQQYQLIRANLQASIQDPFRDGESPSEAQALREACRALAENPEPVLLQALGLFAVGCLASHQKCSVMAENELARILRSL